MTPIQSGPRSAGGIMIVGEAPGREEMAARRPFVGLSGSELTRMLLEVGINRNDCFITNVCHEQPYRNDIENFFLGKREGSATGTPPIWGRFATREIHEGVGQLTQDIAEIRPRLILAFGGTALWALTGKDSIMAWRGSAMDHHGIPLLPTIHPANILRDWSNRHLVVQDLRRAFTPEAWLRPEWRFSVRPSLDLVEETLSYAMVLANLEPRTFAADIETRQGQIACIGIAFSKLDAICIPLMCVERAEGYWNAQEELAIWALLRKFFTHPKLSFIFHNGAYDLQYFAKQMGFLPNLAHDTMLMQHVAFLGMRKSLAMCSSLYCTYHRYWKEDGKEWDTSIPEEQLWSYNCEDCVRTFEVWEELTKVLTAMGMGEQYEFQIKELFPTVLEMMLRGVLVDENARSSLDGALSTALAETEAWINTAVGHSLNPRSPLKIKELLYTDFGLPVIHSRKTGKATTDDEALEKIQLRYPLFAPLCRKILEARSVGVFLNTFVRAPIPPDGRIRTTYNLAGTETLRFSSSADSFGYGTNLQNIPKGDE